MTRDSILIVLTLLVLAAPLFSQETLLAYTEEFPPYNYLEGGKPQGLTVELVQTLAVRAGLALDIRFTSWPRSMEETQRGRNTLLFTMAINDERRPKFHWLLKISDREAALFRLSTRGDLAGIRFEDLKTRYSIAVVKNDAGLSLLQTLGIPPQRIHEIQDLPNRSRTPLSVELGHDDFFLGPPITHRFEVSRGTRKNIFVQELVLFRSDGFYIVTSLDFKPALLARLKAAADELTVTGELGKIIQGYLPHE